MKTDKDVEQEEGRGVGRGAKLGLALIGLLVLVLVGVVLVKLRTPSERAVASDPKAAAGNRDPGATKRENRSPNWQKRGRPGLAPATPTVVPPRPASSQAASTTTSSRWSLTSGGTSPDMSMMPASATASSSAGDVAVLPAPKASTDSSSWQQYSQYPQQTQQTAAGSTTPPGVPSDAFSQSSSASTYGSTQSSNSAYPSQSSSSSPSVYPNYYTSSTPQSSGGSSYSTYTPYSTGSDSSSASAEPNPLRGRHGDRHRREYRGGDSRWQQDNPYPNYSRDQTYGQRESSQPTDSSGYQQAPYSQKAARAYQDPYAVRMPSAGNSLGGRREDGKYVVGPNENYCTISQRLYGTDAYFKALAEVNRQKHPDENRLRVGDVIVAPEESELIAKHPDLCPSPERRDVIRSRVQAVSTRPRYQGGSTYTVQHGDTLFDIAQFKLGAGTRWPEIYDLNADVLQGDFNYVTPGMLLALPEEPSDEVTGRPGSSGARY